MTVLSHAAELFAVDTAGMTMTVAHEDGLYRHLKFRRPDTSLYWFDLVTWPGALTICGDMGAYTFVRTADMLDFFLAGEGINPGYWAEKLQGSEDVRVYSEERMREQVVAAFAEFADEHGWVLAHVAELWGAIDAEVLPELDAGGLAFSAVHAFRFREPRWDDDELIEPPLFDFGDAWDWYVRDYSHQFLWCCHAVRWGAEQYRAAAAVAA